ncbi:hypothetical protein F2P56_026029 [Juglans regia]|uniref:non-specific serine/threonine protein kinase n=2 Tax=Juglans regia TaxID=51240 RepID=A0A2I4GNG0_JUGRE|nr:probable LRR receptor-like serine/threonine-protein kinase At4g31250 [Juglans regia]KAF5456559.1 hypothetical protein F2P56_026029 [Juglans regia]
MAHNKARWLLMLLTTLIHLLAAPSGAAGDDAGVLIKFKSSLSKNDVLNGWNESIDICSGTGNKSNWAGLICTNGVLSGLRLENMSLTGIIDVDTLAELQTLRSLSFMNNSFDGLMPNMAKLGALKTLYLSHNRFSGEIKDDAFDGMNSLKKVYLARNEFMGKIPKSLAALPKLMELNLEGNRFEGKIPNFRSNGWKVFNLADNQLEGRIPKSLSKMNSSSFVGNKDLCGLPLEPCKASRKHYIVIIIILAIAVVALAAMGVFLYARGRRLQKTKRKMAQEIKGYKNSGEAAEAYDVGRKEAQSPDLPGEYKRGEQGKLYFVRNDRVMFDLQDLLRASAEVLGSGSFGSSYKAVLLSGPAMVVKRFRQMNKVGKEEFHDHMRRLGSLSHPNVLPLVAFYYTKEEKLLISDYVQNGSLASHLHARRAPGQPGLDWPARLKIIKGVARGLAYLHREFPNLTLPHGHLKSSNVLLDHTFMPLLSDFALVPVVNKEHAQQYMAAYKSPEFTQRDRTAQKTDVWCLGILILELLTGKFPANYLKHGKGENPDLASWVNSVVREEWTGEVFDYDMKGTKNSEEEMLKLLKVGMCCCEGDVDRRWELREALEKIEDLKERDNEDDNYSSNASEGDMYSSRGMTEEDFSFLS